MCWKGNADSIWLKFKVFGQGTAGTNVKYMKLKKFQISQKIKQQNSHNHLVGLYSLQSSPLDAAILVLLRGIHACF
jgi:hypothetical protein